MLPAWDNALLPEGQASYAVNAYLFSGALVGWRQPKFLRQLKDTTKYVYRLPNRESANTTITATDGFWWEFTNADTTVMRTPVVNDKYLRYYYAAPDSIPMYNTYNRIVGHEQPCGQPSPPYPLGVPAPPVAPIVTVGGGGGVSQLGFQTLAESGGGSDTRPANCIFLVPIVPDGTLLIQSVSFVAAADNPTVDMHAVVYSDLNGRPHELLGFGDRVEGTTAGVTVISTLTNTVSVISNTTYWVGFAHDAELMLTVADETSFKGVYVTNTFSNGPPTIVSTPVAGAATWQVWADLRGDSILEARAYVYTWLTEFAEEGPPSPPTLLNGWANAVWTVTLTPPAPPDPHLTQARIYRSVTSQSGIGTYFYVDTIPIEQTVYTDTSDDRVVALNEQMQSLNWSAPPPGLQAIMALPNGIAVGFQKNEIWFSEPYHPHAWPPGYVITTEFPIVGLGICGQTVVVCTAGTPYLITGVDPRTMAMTKINLHEPCLFRGSIVATDTTVIYISPNGLIQINQSGAGGNVTEGWISRERWQELTPHKYVRAIKHTTAYFAFGTVVGSDNSVAQQGFTVELSQSDQESFTVWPQPGGHRLGFMQLSSPNNYDIVNVLNDAWTGVGLLIQNSQIWYYDFQEVNPVFVPYKWRSKQYQHQSKKNFQALRVWFTVPGTTPAQGDRNTAEPQPALALNQYGIIRLYADDKLWCTRELRKSGELLRIYAGSIYETWSFEIEGRVRVSNFQVATSVRELGLV